MTAQLQLIYDGSTNPSQVDRSDTFTQASFLVFDSPGLGGDEGYEFAAGLQVNIRQGIQALDPLGFGFNLGTREIPLEGSFMDTASVVRIPDEYTAPQFEMRVILATEYSFPLRIWSVWDDCTLAAVCSKQDFANAQLTALSARQFLGDAVQLAEFVTMVGRLLAGDVTGLPGLVGLLVPLPSGADPIPLPDLDLNNTPALLQ